MPEGVYPQLNSKITVTRFMPSQSLHRQALSRRRFWDRTHTGTPWPLPHEMFNSERIPQTFIDASRIAPSASARWQKTLISSARAINEQFIRLTFPASGQRTLENGAQRRVWRQLTSLAARNCLYGLPNIALALDISSYINAYFHLERTLLKQMRCKITSLWCISKFSTGNW